jgi:PAS domain S-box-containing protein
MGTRSMHAAKVRGYVVAIIAVAVAALVRLGLSGVLADKGPFFTFILATLVAASYGGLYPGLLATILGAILGTFLFLAPLHPFRVEEHSDVLVLSLYLLVAGTISAICGALHTARSGIEAKQKQLESAEQFTRSVVMNVVDGIITIDESGIIESVNPAAERLFGYNAAELIGKNVKLLMPEPFHREHDEYVSHFLHTGVAKVIGIGREVEGRRKNGSTFPIDLAVSEFQLGAVRHFTGIVRDITQRKHDEKQIEDLLSALQSANLRKDEFLAILAHELRNPMAVLRQAVDVIQHQSPFDPELQEIKDVIDRQLQQMTRYVEDLSDLSCIIAGKISMEWQRVVLGDVVATAIESSRPTIDAAGHTLTARMPSDQIVLNADPIRLVQVLQNLLSNAAKYTPANGQIWLTGQREGNAVLVSVKDNGVGIASAAISDIFEMFAQGTNTTEAKRSGLGIGLALVRKIVEMHGGTIEVRSDGVGKGSEFMVHLPIAEELELTAPKSGPVAELAASHARAGYP